MNTPADAKQYVLTHLYEQAAIEGLTFTPFETKLLQDTATDPAASEEEIDNFDEEHGEEFWDKVNGLNRHSLARERRTNGFAAWRKYKRALKAAGGSGGYFSGILVLGNFAPLFVEGEGWRGHLITIAAGIAVGLAAVFIAIANAFYGDRFSSWWDSSALSSWLEKYGGVALLGALLAVAVVSAWTWRQGRTTEKS